MSGRETNLVKNRSYDRVITLEKIPGLNTIGSTGLIDNTLFSGDNRLRAIIDKRTMLWSLRQDHGLLPPPLKQQWTSFTGLMKYITDYYKKRNVNVTGVID